MYSHPWNPAQADGTYCNPIIFADYSDPDVIQHGSDFYMISSSFNCTPGIPVLHSRNLVQWRIINHAVKNLPVSRHNSFISGSGVWAPAIRFHDGLFYIFFPMVEDGVFVTTASDPAGTWSEPHFILPGKGFIDPCPFWDDDGKAYLVHAYARSRSGLRDKIHVRPMSPDAKTMLGEGQIVFDQGERHPYMEGPKVHKKGGWYYIFAPAGGVPTGWQAVLRSKNIYGPYEDKIVLEQGSTKINGPHQGALIENLNGEDWFIHFQDAKLYGRITHMQPVKWVNDWPVMGVDLDGNGIGEPVERWSLPQTPDATPLVSGPNEDLVPQTSDLFAGPKLGLQWQWNANHSDSWTSLSERPGWLRFWVRCQPKPKLQECPALLLQKFPAETFGIETVVESHFVSPGDERAGLIVVGSDYAALCLRQGRADGVVKLVLESAGTDLWETEWGQESAKLRVSVGKGGTCTFGYGKENSPFTDIPILFNAKAAEWIGARVGLFAARLDGSRDNNESTGSYADFRYFKVS